jgi:hypothetical protein
MYTSEEFYNQSIEFTYGDSDYIWEGDYRVEYYDEDGDYDTPYYGETKVRIISTDAFLKTNEDWEYEYVDLDQDLKYYLIEFIRESL